MPVAAPVTTMVRFVSRSCVIMLFGGIRESELSRVLGCCQKIQPDWPEYGTPCAGQKTISSRAVNCRFAMASEAQRVIFRFR